MILWYFSIPVFFLAGIPKATPLAATGQGTQPEKRALAYLSREVPAWSAKNKCFSCHNNGDGARALYSAIRQGHSVPKKSLTDTSDWLTRPEQWDKIGDEAGSSDKNLARIQFAAALVDGLDGGVIRNREALGKAAKLIAENQKPDGSWQVDAPGNVGSPATYGPCLATYLARRTLFKADPKSYHAAIDKANHWLERVPVKNVLNAAAVLLALSDHPGHHQEVPGLPALEGRRTKAQGEAERNPGVEGTSTATPEGGDGINGLVCFPPPPSGVPIRGCLFPGFCSASPWALCRRPMQGLRQVSCCVMNSEATDKPLTANRPKGPFSDAIAQRRRCLDLIRQGESKDGGWGPFVNSGPEPFDTAVVMLALFHYPKEPGIKEMLLRGRTFLVKTQQEDGSWPETTRPSGAQSYAQRISTIGWATLALLSSKP